MSCKSSASNLYLLCGDLVEEKDASGPDSWILRTLSRPNATVEICEFRSGNHVGVDVVGVVFRVVSWSVGVIQTCQVLQLREEETAMTNGQASPSEKTWAMMTRLLER